MYTLLYTTDVKTLNVSEFREQCLTLLERLPAEGILITKRGRPLAQLLPIKPATNANLIGSLAGVLTIEGDVFSTGEKWDAES